MLNSATGNQCVITATSSIQIKRVGGCDFRHNCDGQWIRTDRVGMQMKTVWIFEKSYWPHAVCYFNSDIDYMQHTQRSPQVKKQVHSAYQQYVNCRWLQKRCAVRCRCSMSDKSSGQQHHLSQCSAASGTVYWDQCRRHSALCVWMPIWRNQEPAWTVEVGWPEMLLQVTTQHHLHLCQY